MYDDIDIDVLNFEGLEDNVFIEPARAKRRRIRDEKINKTIRWLKENNTISWYTGRKKQPHRYMFLDPSDDEDMMFIWTLTDDDLKPYSGMSDEIVYYVEGYGVKNPPVPIYDQWGNYWYTPDLPHLTDEDVENDYRKEAIKIYDTPKQCSCDSCGNKRHYYGKKYGTRQEIRAVNSFLDAMDELGYNGRQFLKSRITKAGLY